MCWFYMGIAQIALDPHLLCQTGKHGKKCPKPSWQALTPPPYGIPFSFPTQTTKKYCPVMCRPCTQFGEGKPLPKKTLPNSVSNRPPRSPPPPPFKEMRIMLWQLFSPKCCQFFQRVILTMGMDILIMIMVQHYF